MIDRPTLLIFSMKGQTNNFFSWPNGNLIRLQSIQLRHVVLKTKHHTFSFSFLMIHSILLRHAQAKCANSNYKFIIMYVSGMCVRPI